jgi:hypothetical protein
VIYRSIYISVNYSFFLRISHYTLVKFISDFIVRLVVRLLIVHHVIFSVRVKLIVLLFVFSKVVHESQFRWLVVDRSNIFRVGRRRDGFCLGRLNYYFWHHFCFDLYWSHFKNLYSRNDTDLFLNLRLLLLLQYSTLFGL